MLVESLQPPSKMGLNVLAAKKGLYQPRLASPQTSYAASKTEHLGSSPEVRAEECS